MFYELVVSSVYWDEDFGEDTATPNSPLLGAEGPGSWKVAGPLRGSRQPLHCRSWLSPCAGISPKPERLERKEEALLKTQGTFVNTFLARPSLD